MKLFAITNERYNSNRKLPWAPEPQDLDIWNTSLNNTNKRIKYYNCAFFLT